MTKSIYRILFLITTLCLNNSCGGGGSSISVLPTTDAYDDPAFVANPEIDILWVVDPSRSMKEEIQMVQNNIQEFMADFINKGYNFRMGVISTAAWTQYALDANETGSEVLEGTSSSVSVFNRLHNGDCAYYGATGGTPALLERSTTPSLGVFLNYFKVNFDVYGIANGTSGCGLDFTTSYASVPNNIFSSSGYTPSDRSALGVYIGDERPMQSLQAFLEDHSATFVRPNAFLAVIVISDEIDASRDSLAPSLSFAPNIVGQPPIPGNHLPETYVTMLETLKGSPEKFAVFSIADSSLAGIHLPSAIAGSDRTFDINANRQTYIENLNKIRGEIISNVTSYKLLREPLVQTIKVRLTRSSGLVIDVPRSVGGSPGWVYDPDLGEYGSILFVGDDYLPAPLDSFVVDYTPRSLTSGQIKEPYIVLSNTRVREDAEVNTVVGRVNIVNRTVLPTDTVTYEILERIPGTSTTGVAIFDINTAGEVYIANSGNTALNGLNAEASYGSTHQLEVRVTITPQSTLENPTPVPVVLPERNFVISVTDVPDTAPIAQPIVIELSESSALPNGDIIVTGNMSHYVDGMDASEIHTFSKGAITFTGPGAALVEGSDYTFSLNANTGAFQLLVNRSKLSGATSPSEKFEFAFEYTVTGTNTVAGSSITYGAAQMDSDQIEIIITATNNPPIYNNPIPQPVVPENEGVTYGRIPLVASDVTVSGTAQGNKDNLVALSGNANFRSLPNAEDFHEVTVKFPSSDLYEVGCVRIYRDNSSLGNVIYQIQTGDTIPKTISREVFPVSVSGNSNRPMPVTAQGACRILSSSYYTIYTERDFVGGQIKLIRPYGAKNPAGHTELRLNRIEAYGIKAVVTSINLLNHFNDVDLPSDTLTFRTTDAFGEGPAPGWARISDDGAGSSLLLSPSASVDTVIGILAKDASGAEAFATIRVVGSGGGDVTNAPPISILKLDDSKRGGLSMRRWGGTGTPVPGSCTVPSGRDNNIVHIEIDNFIANPFSTTNPNGFYDILNTSANPEQTAHNGDVRSGEVENGWCSTPVHTDDKYPNSSVSFCSGVNFNTTANIGKIIPCLNGARSYGEVYSGFFVPAVSGVYKFRTRIVDNTVLLRMAPTEYHEDTTQVFIANWVDDNLENALLSLTDSVSLNSSAAQFSEFAGTGTSGTGLTNYRAIPYDTNIFYDLNGIPSSGDYSGNYTKGYMYLTQGNVYAFEMRFGEGGGSVSFDFEYNRKDLNGSTWDGWESMDASVVVPNRGVTRAHDPFYIPVTSGSVNFDVTSLFYDAELDLLEYTARLVNADGTPFGTGSTAGSISQIGLGLTLLDGNLSGSLLTAYTSLPTGSRPRIVFRATERFGGAYAESLPIKLQ